MFIIFIYNDERRDEEIEEYRNNKIEITFIIDVPKSTIESDLNSLILRMNDLRNYIEGSIEIDWKLQNKEVEEMQALLENLKYKEY